jgi:diguanylate cyclase (GGDEF)-like protein
MRSIKKLITEPSIRRQYLYIAITLSMAVIAFTWYVGYWVDKTARSSTHHSENRLRVAEINHQLRNAIMATDNALDLFLLSPNQQARKQFEDSLTKARELVKGLTMEEWATDRNAIFQISNGLTNVIDSIETAGSRIMHIRESANLMYPAMRLANGDMLMANREIMTETVLVLELFQKKDLRKLTKSEIALREATLELRNNWQSVINAYRLFLVNRTGSLSEKSLDAQISDVNVFYGEVKNNLEQLKRVESKYTLELEAVTAIEHISQLVPRWYSGFQEVVAINRSGSWRGDIPLVEEVINPLFNDLYTKLDLVEIELKQASDADLVKQTALSQNIIKSLWGVALFVIIVSLLSLVFVEANIIRPIAKVIKGLKAEARGEGYVDLENVKTMEIRDLNDAFRYLLEQIHSRQLALEHIAMHDALTSLPNRTLLMDRLNQSITNAQQRKRPLALLMLDLDHFKEINDTLGHQTGDALLQQVGERLRNVLRDSDTVARLGGDEFAILLPNVNDTNSLRIAAAIHEKLEKVYEVYDHSLYVGVSIGVAVFPQHGETTETLLQHADVAMYMAKRANNGITLYDTTRDEHSVNQLSVLSDLRGAVENEEFILLYQPEFSMKESRIVGAEALIRWKHPKHGLIMPDEFINAAEQTGLIKRISNWVLDTAIRDCQRLHQKGHKISISVNLSVWDIQDANIALTITQKLEKWGLPASYLMLEITERVMMAEPERALQVLTELENMGVQVVVDDFGTGYSSLVYLKQLPVSMLKVDKSFVIDMMDDDSDSAIVRSIIDMAHNLGLQVVAEGVENDQTWSWLRKWECDYAQGFYISHPLALADFEYYLDTFASQQLIS